PAHLQRPHHHHRPRPLPPPRHPRPPPGRRERRPRREGEERHPAMTLTSHPGSCQQAALACLDAGIARDIALMLADVRAVLDWLGSGDAPPSPPLAHTAPHPAPPA